MLRFLPLVILFLLLFSFALVLLRPGKDKTETRTRLVPAIALPDVFSPNVNFSVEEWRGKYVVLNVFASWCGPCKVEHGFLMELAGRDVPIYGLAWRDQPDPVRAFLRQSNPYQRVAVDVSGEVGVMLGITGVPESFLIDPNGTMLLHYVGPLEPRIWEEKFAPYFSH